MKLLQINVTHNTGSTGRIAEDIGKQVIANGGESYVAFGRECNPIGLKSHSHRIGTNLNNYHHAVMTRLFDAHGLASKRATKKFVQWVKQLKPDIIHLHNIHGYYLNYSILFSFLREYGAPVVWTLHDCWAFTGHCAHFDAIGCTRWQNGCKCCPLKRNYPASYFFDRSYRNYQDKKNSFCSLDYDKLAIVSVSNWLDSKVSQSFFRDFNHMVIHNGVDIDDFTNDEPVKSDSNPSLRSLFPQYKFFLMGCATSWTKQKGLPIYAKLSNELPEDIGVFLVGCSPEVIKKYGVSRLISIPRTENVQQLASYYRECDIVLNLSNQESFGLTTVEGLACGTPGIVLNTTASPELIDEKTGVVVARDSLDELKRAICFILSKGKKTYTKNCRDRAVNLFNRNRQLEKYLELYNELMK